MNVLVIDVGGTNVKFRIWGKKEKRSFPSGRFLTPEKMVRTVLELSKDWPYDAISLGLPVPIIQGRPAENPKNLGPGWIGFDFTKAFDKPVKIINDAAMQALGSYRGGRMLFLGLGTGLGSVLILDDVIVPLELGELRFNGKRIGKTLGRKAARADRPAWERRVHEVIKSLTRAFRTECLVIGGGNVRLLRRLPKNARAGSNDKAFLGGARLWGCCAMRAREKKHTWVIT